MNEGFRALPEDVQKKILGKAMGGVMQRPLFRQMGGPAEPMPQDMMQAQPDPQAMVQEAEMAGERVGEQIAAATMTNIDSATDVKGAIDALRGNAAPLEERYQELAGLVGERDAMQTPESVLALTQPAIMMTEQGAMDSGIGELMQSVAGDSEMSGGMDQGVGALMMQGAGNTPPENFRQGGPVMVRHFQDGTPPEGNRAVPAIPELSSFDPFMKRALAAREGILGTEEERAAQLARAQQSAKSDAMFNLANFGLAFAGETEGGTVAERLANAARKSGVVQGFQQAGKDVAAARSAQEQQDTSLRLSALESAERSASDAEARKFEFAKMTYKDLLDDENVLKANELAVANAKTRTEFEREMQNAQIAATDALNKANNAARAALATQDAELRKELQGQAEKHQITLFNLKAITDLENQLEIMGVKNAYDLDMMEAGTQQSKEIAEYKDGLEKVAREDQQAHQIVLQNLNSMDRFELQALEKEVQIEILNKKLTAQYTQADKDRELKRAQMMIDKAFKEDQILQTDRSLNMQEARDLVDKQYKASSLAIDKAVAKLKSTDLKNDNQILQYLTFQGENGEKRIDAFLTGGMENPDEYEGFLKKYTRPRRDWNDSTKSFESRPGNKLPTSIEQKLKAERPELYENVTGKRSKPAEPIQLTEAQTSILFAGVQDPARAFGTPGLVQDTANKLVEAFSYGRWGAPYEDTKEAIVAVDNLNSEFVNFFTQAADIRESVFQQKKLDELTPKSKAFLQGESEATSRATALLNRIKMAEKIVIDRMNSETIPVDSGEYSNMDKQLRQLANLRAGYQMLSNMAENFNAKAADPEQDAMFNDLLIKMDKTSSPTGKPN